jgi:hypothetical protein
MSKPAFVLPYYISNNGDGSVSLNLVPTIQEAQERDAGTYGKPPRNEDDEDEDDDDYHEGFAEETADEIQIFQDADGKLYVEDYWDGPDGEGWEKRKIYLTVVSK